MVDFLIYCFGSNGERKSALPTLNNWTPMTANINWRRHVTKTIFPIVFTATITHWTTCCPRGNCTSKSNLTNWFNYESRNNKIRNYSPFHLRFVPKQCEEIKCVLINLNITSATSLPPHVRESLLDLPGNFLRNDFEFKSYPKTTYFKAFGPIDSTQGPQHS